MTGQPNKSAVRPAGSRSFQNSKKKYKMLGQLGQLLAEAGKHTGNCWKVVPACSGRRGRSGAGVGFPKNIPEFSQQLRVATGVATGFETIEYLAASKLVETR